MIATRNTEESSGVVIAWATNVLRVHWLRHIAQIGESIIQRVSVDVIYVVTWPFACHVKPCEPMRVMEFSVEEENHPSVYGAGNGSSYVANFYAVTSAHFSGKHASLWIVMQKFSKFLSAHTRLYQPERA